MAQNTAPIFLKTPKVSWATVSLTANTATDGTGTTSTVFTADATNGSKVENVYITALGANVATVVRFFVNNGSSSATPANNSLVHEETFAAVGSLSQVAASVQNAWAANLVLPPGYKLLCCQGTTTASQLQVCAVGGDF